MMLKSAELAIHRRVSRLKHLRRCSEASSVQAHMKQASPGPLDEIAYVEKNAKQ